MTELSRPLLALLLASAFVLSGCVSPDLATWGEDGIEVSVDSSAKTATMSTHLGDNSIEDDVANLVGCDSDGNISESDNAMPIHIEGWLAMAKHFPNGVDGVGNAEKMSASAAIIKLSDYDETEAPTTGRLEGVSWEYPTSGVKARPPGETSSSKFPHDSWAVVGLIPANEEILKGFGGLDWHQKIALKGWFLDGSYYPPGVEVANDGDCRVYAGSTGGFTGTMLVTEMTLQEHGLISASEPYDAFSVDIIGSYLYFIIVALSLAGAALFFLLSTGMIRRGAKMTAKELLTEAQMLAARGVKKEISQVMKDIEADTGSAIDVKAKKAEVKKAEKLSSKPEVELDDFDIDSALGTANRPDPRSLRGIGGGDVTETDESATMDDQISELKEKMKEDAEWQRGGRRGGRGGGEPDDEDEDSDEEKVSMKMEKSEAAKPRVRKTKSAKPEPEPEPVEDGPDLTDDDDFSDFSL